jgi:hypothetical protein
VIAAPPPPLPPAVHPWPIGAGPRYHPAAADAWALAGEPLGRLRCGNGATFAVHVELFAARRVVILPPGIGVARSGCTYPLHTSAPTGVVAVRRVGRYTLGDLFRVWGQSLGPSRLLSFHGPVAVFIDGRRRSGDPRRLVLKRHAEIVLEVRGYVAPHSFYLFPKRAG